MVRSGTGEMSVQSIGEAGKDFCSNFIQPFLENIDRRSRNDVNQELLKSNQIIFIGLRSSKDYYKRPGGGVGIWGGS